MKYYIAENGQPAGPFEASEMLAHGLTVNSLVWGEGMPNWVSASQVPELMAILSGNPIGGTTTGVPIGTNTGFPTGNNTGMPLPTPPFGNQQPQQAPNFPQTNQPTMPTGTTNQPYAQPQYRNDQPQQQVVPKTWFTESVLVTVLSALCCCNIFGLVTGVLGILKANSAKNKVAQGNFSGATVDAASAKKWVIITLIIGVVYSCYQAYQLYTNPQLLQQVQESMNLMGF